MLIPKGAIIAVEKVRDYLLVPQRKNDKLGYLTLGGYSREDSWELIRDIREQLLPAEGIFQRRDRFGDYYELSGRLQCPNGRSLGVNTIWIHDASGTIRFLTLFPD
jgi:hypothetical protein